MAKTNYRFSYVKSLAGGFVEEDGLRGQWNSLAAGYDQAGLIFQPRASDIELELSPAPVAVSLTGSGVTYSQDFDGLASAGPSSTLPADWVFSETGTNANPTYSAGTGSSNAGDTWSFGIAGAHLVTDRAFGQIRSGSLVSTLGASFTNNTGTTVTSLVVGYTGEQWRVGGTHTTIADKLDFQISFDATSLTTGTWIDVDQLDFLAPIVSSTAGALDGNLAANRTILSSTISSLNLANGATFWIRWVDVDASGADDGLAIDDFSITPQGGPVLPNLSINDVTMTEGDSGTKTFTFTVSLSAPAGPGGVTFDIATADGTATDDNPGSEDNDYVPIALTGQTIPAGSSTYTFNVTVNGDTAFEPNETFFVNLTNVTGANVTDGQGQGTITNDDVALPTVSIANAQDTEVDPPNTKDMVFIVTLSQAPTSGFVTVNFTTMDGTALATTNGFNNDYVTTTGQVVFGVGETSKEIRVPVRGDLDDEPDETFSIVLSSPVGATIGTGTATGTIIDNDASQSASIADAAIVEGDNGVTYLSFTITLTVPASGTTTVDFATADGSAVAGQDYLPVSGQVSFAAGETSKTVLVPVIGDDLSEANETLTVTLTNPVGTAIGDGTATGTITNDDGPQYFSLASGTFEEHWTDTSRITTNDNWSGVPYIIGYLGDIDAAGATTNVDPRLLTDPALGAVDVIANLSATTSTSGGVGEFQLTDPTIGLQGSGTADAPSIVLYMDATGRADIRLQASLRDIDTTADNAAQQVNVQYRTDPNGSWTNVPGGYFSDVTTGGSATQVTALDVILPPGANGASTLEIRIMTTNAAGNDEWVGIDDIVVSSLISAPSLSIANAAVFEGDAGATPITFNVTRNGSSLGAVTANYTVSFGNGPFDANAADFVAGQAFTGLVSFADGQTSQTITLNVQGDLNPEGDDNFTVTLSSATGGTIADGIATGTIVNDDGPPPLVTINDVTVTEGDSGTSLMTFTVTRTGGTGAFSVDFATADGSATAGEDYVSTGGTLNFAAGETSQTISVIINGDLDSELSETLQVLLSNATNNALITDGVGIGTIASDDPIFIHDIQGTAYFSPILAAEGIHSFNVASAATVIVRAVVTAVDNVGNRQGYYLTEEFTDWDGNTYTSEGIFVMTRNDAGIGTVVSGVSVGDLVQVTANVMEYQAFSSMPRTVLVNPTGFSVISQGNSLTALTLTLTNMPNEVLTGVTPDYFDSADGGGDTFDASVYALSYFETVEGMLVTIPDMVVADGFVSTSGGDPILQAYSLASANPDQINSRGGYTIAGDPPIGPPDTPEAGDDTNHGGRHLHDGDVNPDVIELDFTDFATSAPAGLLQNATMGDHLGDVTGIIDFDFTDRKLFVTGMEPGGFVNGGIPERETTTLGNDGRSLTVATFNVENLDPGDGAARFAAIADAIANNLNMPDIISIEEMQDNNGATASGGADASTTWQMLVDALNLATGAHYQWVDQEPNGSEGGEPGGNIRVGFLYNTDRVQLGDLDANATIAERRQYTDRIGDGVRDAGDLIAFSDDMLGAEISASDWAGTRRSLLGEFTFNGNKVYVTANHFPAKGGSGEFWQVNQNLETGDPDNSGWSQRNQVGQDLYAMLNLIEGSGTGAGIVAGGDFNDFYFYRPLTTVTGYTMADGTARVGGARFDNLTLTLAEAERYTYTFDGRSQAIDHVIANNLLSGVATYDVVHINTGYNANGTGADASPRLSDHDPALSSFDFREFNEVLNGTAAADSIDGFGGNDIIRGGGGDDLIDGGPGTDTARYDGNFADYSIVGDFDSNGDLVGFLSVTDNNPGDGDEGHDTLTSIERLQFADATFNIGDPVLLYDGSNNLIGTFTTIQAAIDAASDGYRIVAEAGTYAEDLTLDKDVTIEGANAGLAGTDGARGAETIIDGSVDVTSAGSGATIDGVEIVGTSNIGGFDVAVNVNANADGFSLVNSVLSGVESITPPAPTFAILTGGVAGLDVSGNLIEGYAIGAYVSGGDTSGTFNDNLFQGDGAGSGTGLQQGIFLETSHVILDGNTFDGIDGAAIFVNPHGPDSVDLRTIILNTIISGSGVERPVQVLASAETPNMIGTDFNEAFYDPNFGGPNEILASLGFDGQGGNDHIFGNSFADDLRGGAGFDRLFGGAGDDRLSGDSGNDLIDGEAGVDSAYFQGTLAFADTAIGWITSSADGNDILQNVEIAVDGTGQRHLLVGATGFAGVQAALDAAQDDDIVRLAAGSHSGAVTYSDDGLTVIGQTGSQQNLTYTTAGAFGISVYGANLADTITTEANNDVLSGGGGSDVLTGGGGSDVYIVDSAGDQVIEAIGGGANDSIYTSASYALNDGSEVETLSTLDWNGTAAIDLTGNGLANYMIGNAGANVLDGGGGADILVGLGGSDVYILDDAGDYVAEAIGGGANDSIYTKVSYTLVADSEVETLSAFDWTSTAALDLIGNGIGNYLIGNAGANLLDGKGGGDILVGQGGADTFAFTTAPGGGNVDAIGDFLSGTDVIALDDAVFAGLSAGDLPAGAFVIGTAAGDADDRIIYDQTTGALYYDADGNGAGAAVQFASLSGAPALSASDFHVI